VWGRPRGWTGAGVPRISCTRGAGWGRDTGEVLRGGREGACSGLAPPSPTLPPCPPPGTADAGRGRALEPHAGGGARAGGGNLGAPPKVLRCGQRYSAGAAPPRAGFGCTGTASRAPAVAGRRPAAATDIWFVVCRPATLGLALSPSEDPSVSNVSEIAAPPPSSPWITFVIQVGKPFRTRAGSEKSCPLDAGPMRLGLTLRPNVVSTLTVKLVPNGLSLSLKIFVLGCGREIVSLHALKLVPVAPTLCLARPFSGVSISTGRIQAHQVPFQYQMPVLDFSLHSAQLFPTTHKRTQEIGCQR